MDNENEYVSSNPYMSKYNRVYFEGIFWDVKFEYISKNIKGEQFLMDLE